MNITLSKFQHEKLQPLFDEVYRKWKLEKPISLIAQIYDTKDGLGYMDVRSVDPETILKIQEITGAEKGKIVEDGSHVMVDIP